MKRFLVYIISILSILVCLNWIVIELNHPRKNYKQKVGKSSLYILGDSHALGFNPKCKEDDKTYNLSYGSDNLIDFDRKFDYLIKKGYLQRGDTLILEVDLQVFSKYRLHNNNNDISGIYTDDFYSLKNYYFPLIGEVKVLDEKIFKALLVKKNKKRQNETIKLKTREDSLIIKNRYKLQFGKDFKFESKFLNILSEIVKRSEKLGIILIAIHYPFHPYYNKLLNRDHSICEMINLVESIVFPYKLYNYSNKFKANKYFKNQDHLNNEGKIRLQEIFKEDIINTDNP